MLLKLQGFFPVMGREGIVERTGRDVTRQQQQLYVNVWQTGPVKIKQCTETIAYHYSLHMLQYSTAVNAVCTQKPDGFKLHWLIRGLLTRKHFKVETKARECATRDNTD